jgi:hypothetical protein
VGESTGEWQPLDFAVAHRDQASREARTLVNEASLRAAAGRVWRTRRLSFLGGCDADCTFAMPPAGPGGIGSRFQERYNFYAAT